MWTDISYLDVRLESGLESGALYGNSRHQLCVVISIIPTDGTKKVAITAQQLNDSITMLDYVTGIPFKDGKDWVASTTANDYYAAVPNVSAAMEVPGELVANSNGLYQAKRYISCDGKAKLRAKSIAVQIKPTDGAAVNSALHGAWDAGSTTLALTALEAIDYKLLVNVGTLYIPIRASEALGNQAVEVDYHQVFIDDGENGVDRYLFKAKITPNGSNEVFLSQPWLNGVARVEGRAWPPGKTSPSSGLKHSLRDHEVCIAIRLNLANDGSSAIDKPVDITLYDQYGNRGILNVRYNAAWEASGSSENILLFLDGEW